MSPYLALELGLIDQVGDGLPETQDQCAATDGGGLTIPEWAPIYSDGRVPRAALTRHSLILGETGSGKTCPEFCRSWRRSFAKVALFRVLS